GRIRQTAEQVVIKAAEPGNVRAALLGEILRTGEEASSDLLGGEVIHKDLLQPGVHSADFGSATEELLIVVDNLVGEVVGAAEKTLHNLVGSEVQDIDVADPVVDLGLRRLSIQDVEIQTGDEACCLGILLGCQGPRVGNDLGQQICEHG